GRYTCTARNPKCSICPLRDICDYYARLQRLPAPIPGLDPKRGTYFCKTNGRYFDKPVLKTDRHGVEQIADPVSGSMNVFLTRTGETTRKAKHYRIWRAERGEGKAPGGSFSPLLDPIFSYFTRHTSTRAVPPPHPRRLRHRRGP